MHLSVPVVLEYRDVLLRDPERLGLTAEEADLTVNSLCFMASLHDIHYVWRPALRDPKDEIFLELAVTARCPTIVTHNIRDFRGTKAFGIEGTHTGTISQVHWSPPMTRVTFRLPDSIHARAKVLAKRDGISLDQLMASAVAEKISVLERLDYLKARAARGSREEFHRILAKVPARKPLKGDEWPGQK